MRKAERLLVSVAVLLAALIVPASRQASAAVTILVPTGSVWKYLDNGSNQGTAWRAAGFADGAWASGAAQLGYGDGDEATVVSFGPNASAKFITTYFRRAFTVADPSAFAGFTLRLLRDDGAVVYLNGAEVFRSNMPGGTITSTTLASAALGGVDETTFVTASVPASSLVAGTNVLAVEVHQANGTSTDVTFDLELSGSTGATVTRGPYLQTGTPTSAIVRWRTDVGTDSRVRYGTAPESLTGIADGAAGVTEHTVTVTGLSPNTLYYYSVGTATETLAGGDATHFFRTHPIAGTSVPTRVWVLGDSGTANASAAAVRNAYATFTGTRATDVWLMLGDNAYETGTDAEYEAAVFDMYPGFLRQAFLWPTLGNHDTAGSSSPPASLPYYQIFNLPVNGAAGGIGLRHRGLLLVRLRQHPLRLPRLDDLRPVAHRTDGDVARERPRRDDPGLAHRVLAPPAVQQGIAQLRHRSRSSSRCGRTSCPSSRTTASTSCSRDTVTPTSARSSSTATTAPPARCSRR